MKKLFFTILFIVAAFALQAQGTDWRLIDEYDGVKIYWRARKEAADQYRTELQFKNENAYKVSLNYRPVFTCASGEIEKVSSTTETIEANETKGGQWIGAIWYPCDGKEIIRACDIQEIKVKKYEFHY